MILSPLPPFQHGVPLDNRTLSIGPQKAPQRLASGHLNNLVGYGADLLKSISPFACVSSQTPRSIVADLLIGFGVLPVVSASSRAPTGFISIIPSVLHLSFLSRFSRLGRPETDDGDVKCLTRGVKNPTHDVQRPT